MRQNILKAGIAVTFGCLAIGMYVGAQSPAEARPDSTVRRMPAHFHRRT